MYREFEDSSIQLAVARRRERCNRLVQALREREEAKLEVSPARDDVEPQAPEPEQKKPVTKAKKKPKTLLDAYFKAS